MLSFGKRPDDRASNRPASLVGLKCPLDVRLLTFHVATEEPHVSLWLEVIRVRASAVVVGREPKQVFNRLVAGDRQAGQVSLRLV